MARRSSIKSLKSEKPHWYCIAERFGDVRSLAASGIPLSYVTDPRDIASVWRYLGNPKFRSEYDYLLISPMSPGVVTDIYAVRLPQQPEPPKRRGRLFAGDFDAFSGEVDRILYGWASKASVKKIQETGTREESGSHTPPF